MTDIERQLLEKAKLVKSVDELKQLAKENNIELTEEQVKSYMEQLFPVKGELGDDELDNVAGGGCSDSSQNIKLTFEICDNWLCKECGKQDLNCDHYSSYGFHVCQDCKFATPLDDVRILCNK